MLDLVLGTLHCLSLEIINNNPLVPYLLRSLEEVARKLPQLSRPMRNSHQLLSEHTLAAVAVAPVVPINKKVQQVVLGSIC